MRDIFRFSPTHHGLLLPLHLHRDTFEHAFKAQLYMSVKFSNTPGRFPISCPLMAFVQSNSGFAGYWLRQDRALVRKGVTLSDLNQTIFLYLNASEQANTTWVFIAKILADYAILVVPLLLLLGWVKGTIASRKLMLEAII